MARGSGKSSLTESAAIWAMAYGHREFVVIIGASEGAALEMLDSIKTELEVNEHLAEDFPEMVYPIACLEGIANRCAGQLYKGERTRIAWTASEIVLPTIVGAASSGAVVRVAGITGRIRGMKYKRPDGRTVRPEFVIVDDPQTSESAGSAEQTRKRVRVLAGDVLGLAGPGRKIAGVMPCTVIRPGDMAEQMLDRAKHPEWNGERCKMLYQFPKNEELWNRYADLRADELRERGTFAKATEFYRRHRAEMDEGAVVAWSARYNHDELSAVQHAMDLKLTDEAAFWAEYQNDPLPEDLGTEEQLTVDGIVNNLNGHSQRGVPVSANHITMFVDVQKTLLFYVVCAWDDDFTGRVIVARPEAAVLLARGREPDSPAEVPACRPRRMPLRRTQGPHRGLPFAGVHAGRRRGDAHRAMPHRRELGPVHRGRVPVLPRGPLRQRDPAEPRQVHRRVLEAHERIQADGRRPRRTQLADAEHTRQAGRPACRVRHELLEVVCGEPPPHPDGRSRKPLALGARDGAAHALRRASHRRVPRQDRGARPQGGRVEDAARGARQPLVRRRRRLRGRRVDVRLRPRGDGHRAGAQAREAQGEAVRAAARETRVNLIPRQSPNVRRDPARRGG